MIAPAHVTVLGGGPAGLAAAYFARTRGWTCRLLEAADRVGGNCVTIERDGYRVDSGAHRFHDKDPEITAIVRTLLGDELRFVSAPSAISLNGRWLPFPPSTRQLVDHLGIVRCGLAGVAAMAARVRGPARPETLESFAVRAYGRPLARLFLLNYSEKLWGVPCDTLSPATAGGRLRGLRWKTLWSGGKGNHLEGSFLYPAGGYGRITTRLAEESGSDVIRTEARITRLRHDGARITHVEVNDGEQLPVDHVISTLPLGVAVRLFDPPLPADLRALATAIRFRNVRLAVFCLNRPSVSTLATMYFPDPTVPFTRVYEPRNRSPLMSPDGRTSLAVEVPCGPDDDRWREPDAALLARVEPALVSTGLIDRRDVIDAWVMRLSHAYPVLTLEAERAAVTTAERLGAFGNLHLIGRNGLFHYGWLHTMMRMAKGVIDALPAPAST